MSHADFGASHMPGYIPKPDMCQDPASSCNIMPLAQSGTGTRHGFVVQPRLQPRSCCPPPWPEPLGPAAASEGHEVIAARQAERERQGEELMNRLVYDSLQQPLQPSSGTCTDCAGPEPTMQSGSSSCRTTTSSKSLNTSADTGVDSGSGQQPEPQAPAAPAPCVYASSLPPWYMPEGPADATLVFESRFESGNLRRAIQVCTQQQQQLEKE